MYRKAVAFLLAAAALAAAPLAAQTPLRVGQTVSGSLDADDPRTEDGAPYDTYVISGRPGDRVLVRMRSSDFDTYLRWGYTDADGAWMEEASNDDGGEGTDSRLAVTLGDRGRYELRAGSFGGDEDGAYELEASELAAPRPTALRVGQAVEGELTESDYEGDNGFEDHYVLAGRAGDVVTVFAASEVFDTYVTVGTWQDGAFTETSSDDDGGEGTNSQLVVEMPGREVHVIVRSFSGESGGPYSLRVQEGAAPPVEEEEMEADFEGEGFEGMAEMVGTFVGPVRAGEEVQGTLGGDEVQDEDGVQFYREYSYRAAAGERLVIQVQSEEMDSYVGIGTGRGEEFASMAEDDDGGEGLDSRLEFQVPEAGTYTIRVTTAYPGLAGDFVLRVSSER